MTSPLINKLDIEKYIERIFWDVYYAGKEDAKHLAGSNKKVFESTQQIIDLINREQQQLLTKLISQAKPMRGGKLGSVVTIDQAVPVYVLEKYLKANSIQDRHG